MKFDPNPGYQRVLIIGFLIFLEAVLVNMYAILQQGRFPTRVELASFLCVGLIQLVTYWLGFLRKET